MAELEKNIKLGRGRQKELFRQLADKLSAATGKFFCVARVQRKWQTLMDGYKKAKLNDSETGKSPSNFFFFSHMQQLIGSRHDIDFPITGTATAITIHRTDEIDDSCSIQSWGQFRSGIGIACQFQFQFRNWNWN